MASYPVEGAKIRRALQAWGIFEPGILDLQLVFNACGEILLAQEFLGSG